MAGFSSTDAVHSLRDLQWTCVTDPPLVGWRNMARDHGLALASVPGQAVVRFYSWTRPTVSFGRNEPAGRYRLGLAMGEFDFVRRPTGGRAVLHDDEMTYAVVVPRAAIGRVRQVYSIIQESMLEGLSVLGVTARVAGPGPNPAPGSGPCFAAPAQGELVVDGRKLLGSAQARIGGAILQHGSLLLSNDQGGLDLSSGKGRAAKDGPVTLEETLGRLPEWAEVADALRAGLARRLGVRLASRVLTERELSAETSLQARYRSDDWTWRR